MFEHTSLLRLRAMWIDMAAKYSNANEREKELLDRGMDLLTSAYNARVARIELLVEDKGVGIYKEKHGV